MMEAFVTPHYEAIGLVLFCALAILPLVPFVILFTRWLLRRQSRTQRSTRQMVWSFLAALCVYLCVVVDAYWIEPNWPRLNQHTLSGTLSQPLRVLHISDTHIEPGQLHRQDWVIDQIRALKPDLIIMTGDILQLSSRERQTASTYLEQIQAPLGVYACVGYDNVSLMREIAPHITFLTDQVATISHKGDVIGICGLMIARKKAVGALLDTIKEANYRIAFGHTPAHAEFAARQGADLYLCGHTHGGQVRIPVWGAIITNSETGKRYESGLTRLGKTHIHTSRGIGLEPKPAPQVRFLCRPEMTLFTIQPPHRR